MAIKTIDCVDCGASVPYGRLSCPGCGALLATVSGGLRPGFRIVDAGSMAPQAEAASGPPIATLAPVVQAHVRGRPKVTPKRPPAGAGPEAEVVVADEPIVVAAQPGSLPAPTAESAAESAADLAVTAPEAAAFAVSAQPAFAPTGGLPLGAALAPTPWEPLREPAPVLVARPYQRHGAFEPSAGAGLASLPGAYLPPAPAPAATASLGDPGSMRAGRAPTVRASPARAIAPTSTNDVSETARAAWRGIDAATLVEIAGWFVIVGSSMAILGFLLPWSVTVIGSSGVGGYFNGWGLASPTHLIVELGLLVGLALGIVPNKVPTWVRSGLYGVAVGALLLGLVWPYLVGRLGSDVGVTVTALGGLALVVGGVVASWGTRHGVSDPNV
ncbi:MAG: hypothetical protein ABI553_01420 [Chloroflexota bacterium]